jgi:glycosyltransferase involved in cell wall biosynthesis
MAVAERDRFRVAFVGLTQRSNSRSFGGAPVVIVNLANELVGRGVPVDVLIFTRRGVTEFPFPFDPRVKLHFLRARSRTALLFMTVSNLLKIRPVAMLAVGTKANLLCAQATRVPGVGGRFWATFHHNLSSEMAGWNASKRHRRVRLWRRILGRAQGMIAVSRGVATDFIAATGIDEDRIRVVYNPIVAPGLVSRAEEPAEHPWFTDGGPPVILGVGRLTTQKDFATLVSAFAQIHRRRPCRLLIIGEGEERERLQALAAVLGVADALELAGFQPNPLPFMREARLLAMSSRWEGFGNVLVEALYCGTPVVSTDCPHGPREVLADGEFGRLVPVGDPQALADGIVDALDEEPPDPRRLKERAEIFSAARSLDQYLEVLGISPLLSGRTTLSC